MDHASPRFKPAGQLLALADVLIDDQHMGVGQGGRCQVDGAIRRLEWNGEPEFAAQSRGALDTDLTIHGVDQLTGDGQAETGAAELAGGRTIGLGEGVEDPCLLGEGDADAGVADLDVEQR